MKRSVILALSLFVLLSVAHQGIWASSMSTPVQVGEREKIDERDK